MFTCAELQFVGGAVVLAGTVVVVVVRTMTSPSPRGLATIFAITNTVGSNTTRPTGRQAGEQADRPHSWPLKRLSERTDFRSMKSAFFAWKPEAVAKGVRVSRSHV